MLRLHVQVRFLRPNILTVEGHLVDMRRFCDGVDHRFFDKSVFYFSMAKVESIEVD